MPDQSHAKTPRIARRILAAAAAGGTLVFTLHLLYSALCAFSWQNFLMSDYGNYTNTVWNLAHGNGFKFLVTHNYLKTHLSFSLAALAPLFYLWNSPCLLIVVQWLFLVGGALFLFRTMRRSGTPLAARWAILFFYTASPFTQSTLLSEFHFVSAYLVLVPALYYCTCFRKAWTPLPLLLLLGMREDAALLLPAFFVYQAWKGKWKAGYVYAALSLAYAVAAVLWLYPLINGVSLFAIRDSEAGLTSIAGTFGREALLVRAKVSLWFFAAYLPFLVVRRGRAWLPLLVIPALPYIIAMSSGYPRQHALQFHYPAALMAFAAVAMIQAWTESRSADGQEPGHSPWPELGYALAMIAVVSCTHTQRGYFMGGGESHRVYAGPHVVGRAAYRAARHIPREGTLICCQRRAVFCANREDITTWTHWRNGSMESIDIFFCDYAELLKDSSAIVEFLRDGSFGVRHEDFPYLVVQRGHATDRNAEVLGQVDRKMLPFAAMPHCAALALDASGLVAYWHGNGSKAPCYVAHGHRPHLAAGRYLAHFELRASAPERNVRNNWGYLSLYVSGDKKANTEHEIEHVPHTDGEYRIQSVPIELATATTVEPCVTGGDAELWLRSVWFEKVD